MLHHLRRGLCYASNRLFIDRVLLLLILVFLLARESWVLLFLDNSILIALGLLLNWFFISEVPLRGVLFGLPLKIHFVIDGHRRAEDRLVGHDV